MILQIPFFVIITMFITLPPIYAQPYYYYNLPYFELQDSKEGYIIAKPGCSFRCGGVDISYPFGMKDPKCYGGKWFEVECRETSRGQKPFLKSLNLEVMGVGLNMVHIKNPIFYWNCPGRRATPEVINLRGSPFVYSPVANTFVAVGCNNLAFLQSNGSTVACCASMCDDSEEVNENFNLVGKYGCSGRYCCETSLPKYLSEYNATLQHFNTENNNTVSEPCTYAFIAYPYSYWQDTFSINDTDYIEAVLEWEILDNTLDNSTRQSLSELDCNRSNVGSSQNTSSGWRCDCLEGFYGNPYVAGGCTAIPGYYKHSQAKKWAIVGVSSSLGSIIFLLGLWLLYKVARKRMIEKRKQKFFKKNGGLLLQQRMSSNEANVDKAILFSLDDLEKATDNFNMDRVLGKGGQGTVYKGMLVDGRIVAVKKFKVEGNIEEFINEFVILSQINNRNVVKLLGCCLETEIPLLVYEFIPNGNLFEYLHDQTKELLPMTWEMCLRIATEIAGALFYLHSVASKPIYHRDIKSTNILLDEKYRAKIADFGTSRVISIEATHLTTVVQGTFGYLDPEYFHTSQFTEKSDVYSFGVVLAELLTGQKAISPARSGEFKSLASYFVECLEEDNLFDIIDKRVMKEAEKGQIIAVANLANRCLELNGKKRPTMKEITLELEGIHGLVRKCNAEKKGDEVELARVGILGMDILRQSHGTQKVVPMVQ
ncbi:wall-associated receptor kinase-like 10 [Vigna umbellata]|uniref:wall-associated receptor kinase-like 10 n=1 Tax=Vigna umbellata TaxID=87088 RepID=UPI001F5F2A3C|nr:wall-associated receptor kinase-like 10 [Vigna umbellata]